jgi:hypothetical protein
MLAGPQNGTLDIPCMTLRSDRDNLQRQNRNPGMRAHSVALRLNLKIRRFDVTTNPEVVP